MDTEDADRTGEGPEYDPDADPEMMQPQRLRPQPDQAEGADDPAETGGPGSGAD